MKPTSKPSNSLTNSTRCHLAYRKEFEENRLICNSYDAPRVPHDEQYFLCDKPSNTFKANNACFNGTAKSHEESPALILTSRLTIPSMALLGSQADYQIRHSNKEPEWSRLCNNVFDQYLDADDLFGLRPTVNGRSSSNDSVNLFDFSGSSKQSHQTDGTSPLPLAGPCVALQADLLEAKQPRAKEAVGFWEKTLKALERNAAECENRQRKLRSTKSHPDFLSLGGYPTPPAIPSSPTEQAVHIQQRLPRSAANGEKRNITSRSLSRGRSTGVAKTAVAAYVKPHASLPKASVSPPKMMSPSRYRAGFKDVWAEKVQTLPKTHGLRIPSLPASPPPSARVPDEDQFAAFGHTAIHPALATYDEHISPLTNTFRHTHICTPIASPTANYLAHAQNSHFEPLPPLPPTFYPQDLVPPNDTAPLYSERTSPVQTHGIHAFDFGFSSPTQYTAWTTTEPLQYSGLPDPFGPLSCDVLPSTELPGLGSAGLGISCDPSLVSNYPAETHTTTLPVLTTNTTERETTPYYVQPRASAALSTPHRRSKSCHRSQSPSPSPPATEPRSTGRKGSSSRRASRHHRRTKSTNSTPRHPPHYHQHHPSHSDKNGGGSGFVNYTPEDSGKILRGVAPSGSSKTKARREREAADRRRRFSQAAIKAVVEAGGDADALSKAGFLI